MQDLGRLLLVIGVFLAVLGIVLLVASRFGLGRLPGDLIISKGPVRIYIPLVSSLLISLVLSLLFWLFRK